MSRTIGVNKTGDSRFKFTVWAPFRNNVQLKITGPDPLVVDMERDKFGYWSQTVSLAHRETRYRFILDNELERPDPVSHFQPEGVHSDSQIIDHDQFLWEDHNWKKSDLSEMIIYELHTGLFTNEGTFEAAVSRLDEICNIGTNAIELMPVAQFPGTRNWGYDGVYPFAVQNSYGGPTGLKNFVNECHKKGINVIVDVVYNHLGPEGNYLRDFGPYFTGKYRTPWGDAVNFDDRYSDHVRNYFIQNALHWFKNYHIDALRLDAVHAIFDMSAYTFLEELSDKVIELSEKTGDKHYLIAESALNDIRIIDRKQNGGYGYDAQWSDDFHHSLHSLITGERNGYYMDYGKTWHLAKALKEGFVYSGQYSEFRKKRYGSNSQNLPAEKFVVFSQNHDQTGNRINGERLSVLIDFQALKVVAGLVILSPYIPLLFMGEEYGEESPFLYFISHSDVDLVKAVREGRKSEFRDFLSEEEPPDPQSLDTFLRSRIRWEWRSRGKNLVLLNYYKEIISLRKSYSALSNLSKNDMEIKFDDVGKLIIMRRWCNETGNEVYCVFNLNDEIGNLVVSLPEGKWNKILHSSEKRWMGNGSLLPDNINNGVNIDINPSSVVVYSKSS